MSTLQSYTGLPGMDTAVVSTENAFLWGPNTWYLLKGVTIVSTATDSGSTPTTDLRPGLVMGKVTSSGKYTAYSATATNGSGIAEGALFGGVRMISPLSGSAADQLGQLVVAGPVKGGSLNGLDQLARSQMHGRFIFDDDPKGNRHGWLNVVAKTADYTVTAADHDTIFTNQGAGGAVIFTLPAIAKGLKYRFFCEADQTITVASAAGDIMVCFNDAAADSISFSTATEKVGGAVEVLANADGTKWLVFVMLGAETQTPTIAT